jgi:hypothetical protein
MRSTVQSATLGEFEFALDLILGVERLPGTHDRTATITEDAAVTQGSAATSCRRWSQNWRTGTTSPAARRATTPPGEVVEQRDAAACDRRTLKTASARPDTGR